MGSCCTKRLLRPEPFGIINPIWVLIPISIFFEGTYECISPACPCRACPDQAGPRHLACSAPPAFVSSLTRAKKRNRTQYFAPSGKGPAQLLDGTAGSGSARLR